MSEPTPSQALLLFGLLARHGACPQAELVPAVKKADREALVKAKLIGVAKAGRSLHLTLEDAGWAWAGANLSAELPPAQRALHDILSRLGEHLARAGATLAEIIGSKPEPAPRVEKALKRSAKGRRAERAGPGSAKEQILAAYARITGGGKGTDVALADLRAQLPRLGRAEVDVALTEMYLEFGKVRLMRVESNRALTEADRQAALHFKGNVFHILWIEP